MADSLFQCKTMAAIPIAAIPMKNIIIAMVTIQSSTPIDKAIWLNKWALVGYIATLFVVALMTFLSWWAGSHLQDVIQKDADARIAEADGKAATANENAGKANERAGIANDSAAKANERAQKLESDNLTLRSQVATLETQAVEAKKDLAGLQKAAADAQAAQQRVETDLAKQQERAAKAEMALAELQERTKWRTFTPEQRARILERLKALPTVRVKVRYLSNNDEAKQFARQLSDLLSEAGWVFPAGYTIPDMFPAFSGLRVIVGAPQQGANAESLRRILREEAGMDSGMAFGEEGANPSFILIHVGLRP